MLNSILWGNEADEVELDVDSQVYFDVDSIKLVRFCCVQDDSPGGTVPFSSDWQNDANSIDSDPLFVDASANNYHLFYNSDPNVTSSPAIDSGSNALLTAYGADAVYADMDGLKRIQDRVVDMGCYENGDQITGEPADIVLMCWIDESESPSPSNYFGDETKYLNDLAAYQAELEVAEARGLVVKSGVYVPKVDFEKILPDPCTPPDDLPWGTINTFKIYDPTWTAARIDDEAMDDYLALTDGIPMYLVVVVVDDSSTNDDINGGVAIFAAQVVNDGLAENVIIYDVDEQGGSWSSEDWLNEMRLMLDYVD